ncbi:MAG: 9-cis-epoxycarotenoid dioxygenase [Acidobacteria bacterium]|nr:MAG: 9-cis-epoxycarotenoid dioxygenase [Acidobacteriota bacterium]REK08499.1 MAG: 9-cis-epoxycarotenoid dioxygenase [Acidobacteriota bacterium]
MTQPDEDAIPALDRVVPREAVAHAAGEVDPLSPEWSEYLERNQNPFLKGNFAPISEEITAEDLPVIGELPQGLEGMFVRNGPNSQFPPKGRYHWFDGDGMLHGVRLEDGRASYRNRWVRTFGFEMEQAAKTALWTGLTEMPNFADPPHGKMFKNTANTALAWHQGRLFALQEGGNPHLIEVPSLRTVGEHDFAGRLSHAFTAHPKVCPQTGEMVFFGYSVMGAPYLNYSVVSEGGELASTEPIDLARPVMMHDFAVTATHTIFMDLPLVFDPMRLAEGLSPFHFDEDSPSRFGIVPRHGGNADVRWFEAPPCYVFHTLNAWNETNARGEEEVVLVACRMPRTDVATPPGHSTDGPAHGNGDGRAARSPEEAGRPHRWRFNLTTGAVSEEQLDDLASDFPRHDPRAMGRRHRYGYTALIELGGDETRARFEGLSKIDLDSGATRRTRFGAGRFGGEAVFAPRPGGQGEDDGWLLTIVRDERERRSELCVWDAREMGDPVARVLLPQRVPYGFHAEWLAGV